MSLKFSVTLVSLQADCGRASTEFDRIVRPDVTPEELQQLLENFRKIDPVDLVTVEPEILTENRRGRYVIRAGEGRLYLQNRASFDEPTLALTPAEIVAELDGTAQLERARRAAEAKEREAAALLAQKEAAPAAIPAEAVRPIGLSLWVRACLAMLAFCFLGYAGFSCWRGMASGEDLEFEPIVHEEEIGRHRAELAGVYMSGSRAGDHGIALAADGTMRLFTLNASAPPSQILDTFQLGRVDQQLCLRTRQPGGLIRVMDQDTLEFCREAYRRLR